MKNNIYKFVSLILLLSMLIAQNVYAAQENLISNNIDSNYQVEIIEGLPSQTITATPAIQTKDGKETKERRCTIKVEYVDNDRLKIKCYAQGLYVLDYASIHVKIVDHANRTQVDRTLEFTNVLPGIHQYYDFYVDNWDYVESSAGIAIDNGNTITLPGGTVYKSDLY